MVIPEALSSRLHTASCTGVDGVCEDDSRADKRVVTIDGYEDVPPYDEVALKKAASRQPVSVAIEADQRVFQLYQGGVFDDENCGEQLDHGVLVSTSAPVWPLWLILR